MKTPSLLLFDLGGVLIENAGYAKLNSLLAEPYDDHMNIKERWLFSPSIRRFELGLSSPLEFAAEFIAEWEIALTAEAFLEEFVTWPRNFYPEALETIAILKQSYRVACLSNSNEPHWDRFNGFLDVFEPALSSHLIGAIKPDPEAFLLAIEACGVKADEIYFFDDLAANVETAEKLGIKAFQVEGFNDLKQILLTQGLLLA